MRKFLIALFLVVSLVAIASAWGENYNCPDDSCNLIWTGKTEFCVGINCRTVKIYRCGCCSKLWRVYVD
jgi:hypothetical protein